MTVYQNVFVQIVTKTNELIMMHFQDEIVHFFLQNYAFRSESLKIF